MNNNNLNTDGGGQERMTHKEFEKVYERLEGKTDINWAINLLPRLLAAYFLAFCVVGMVNGFSENFPERLANILFAYFPLLVVVILFLIYIFLFLKKKIKAEKIIRYGRQTSGKIIAIHRFKGKICSLEYTFNDENGGNYIVNGDIWRNLKGYVLSENDIVPVYYFDGSLLDYGQIISQFALLKQEADCQYEKKDIDNFFILEKSGDDFLRKYLRIMNLYLPIWRYYLIGLGIIILINGAYFLISRNYYLTKIMFLIELLLFVLVFLGDIIGNQVINLKQYLTLKTFYKKGTHTEGILLSCDCSAADNPRFNEKIEFPNIKVNYKFRLPSGKYYFAGTALPIPVQDFQEKINGVYPVYYMKDDPSKSTIDIFGFTPSL